MNGRRYYILTMGCQMNEADSRALAGALERRGFAPTTQPESADLVVLNTCVVRKQAEDKALARLHALAALRRERPEMRVAMMGCLVGVHPPPDLGRRFPFVDIFLPPSNLGPLWPWLEGEIGALPPPEPAAARDTAGDGCAPFRTPFRDDPIAYVPAVLGCSHACTYCIVPYRRGPERSRPPEAILDQIRAAAEQGAREVVLLGQIVDRYGADRPDAGDLADLLRATAAVPAIRRVRFLTSHPSYLSDRIIRTVAEHSKVCPVFELPIQSGNDALLTAMRRGYTVDDYRRLVDRIRARLPEAAVHTDVIVGFPGETDARFEDTVRLIETLEFAKVHLAKYSPRPQTYAARRLKDDVPPEEKERRHRRLDEIQKAIQARQNAVRRGRTVEVLVEGRDEKRGRWRGRTVDDRLVFFASDTARVGDLAPVRIEWAGPFTLVGTAEDGIRTPAG